MKDVRREDWRNLKPTVLGWGINDVNYPLHQKILIDGKRKTVWRCPYYKKWTSMIRRSFSLKYQICQPTYVGCTICEEWRYFSKFVEWVDSQPNRDWQKCELDKDFLFEGNKNYSPETSVFITKRLNLFAVDRSNDRGKCSIGVTYSPKLNKSKPFRSECANPVSNESKHLGYFSTELEAHGVWQAKKHEYACLLAEQQQDPRVAKALRERYAPDKDWSKR